MSSETTVQDQTTNATVYSAFVNNTLTSVSGDSDSLYAFCREPEYRSRSILKKEQTILQLFFDSYSLAFELPLMLNTRDGEPFFEYEGDLWTARKRIQGTRFDWRHFNWSEAHAKVSGEALAQIHSVSMVPGLQDDLQSGLAAKELDYTDLIRQKLSLCKNTATRWLKGDIAALFERLDVLLDSSQFKQIATSTRCFIHGDFHPGNVIYHSAKSTLSPQVKAVIDWDYSRWGSQIIDFCLARLMFAGSFRRQVPQKSAAPKDQDSLLDSYSRAFVLGYKRTLARVLKNETLYPEGIVSWEEQSLSQNQIALSLVDEDSLRPYHLTAMLLIALFELECIEAQKDQPDQTILNNLEILVDQISRVCVAF
jgi:hypothetical protein